MLNLYSVIYNITIDLQNILYARLQFCGRHWFSLQIYP